jgi:elongation factor G
MYLVRAKIAALAQNLQDLLDAASKFLYTDDAISIEGRPDGVWIYAADDSALQAGIEEVQRQSGVNVEVGKPSVVYMETITRAIEWEGRFIEYAIPAYGHVWLRLSPLETGAGVVIRYPSLSGWVPEKFFPAIESGIREALKKGPLGGNQVTDLEVSVFDGSWHDTDSTESAFSRAAWVGCEAGLEKCRPVFLEPIVLAEVMSPADCIGNVMGYLATRGLIVAMEEVHSRGYVIRAEVPMAELLGYAAVLTEQTGGQGSFSVTFLRYQKVASKDPDDDEPASMALRVA